MSRARATGRRRAFAGLVGASLLALVGAASSEAHAVLVRSAPPSRAALVDPPARVQLWFNERLEPAFSSASVWSATGAQVDRGDSTVGPEDTRQLSLTLKPLAPGTYSVRYRVLSVDGHVVESAFSFTVKGGAAPR